MAGAKSASARNGEGAARGSRSRKSCAEAASQGCAPGDGYNGEMQPVCHRCQANLPEEVHGHGSSGSDEERALFCARCGAPQVLLPAYMRSEVAADPEAAITTGAVPPPRPQTVEWSVALGCMLPVAVFTATFAVLGVVSGGAFFLASACVLCGSSVVLGIYRARRPLARINGQIGVRIGLVLGILMVAFSLLGFSAAGVVERFGLHGMASFDELMQRQQSQQQVAGEQMAERMLGTKLDPEMKEKESSEMASPEFRAGSVLAGVSLQAVILVGLTSALGGLAGLLQTRRRALR